MKKVFMSLAIVAAMFAAVSCACNNNSKKAEAADACCSENTECCETKCDSAKCAGCDKAAECANAACEGCDSTATDCCNKAE